MSLKDKDQYNEYMKKKILERYYERRKESIEILGGCCIICQTTEKLEIDHINPKTKAFPISKLWSINKKDYLKELTKCQLLCKDHHELKTKLNGEFGGGHNRIDDYNHGSGHMYNKEKCRCNLCKQWRKEYREKNVDYMGRKRD